MRYLNSALAVVALLVVGCQSKTAPMGGTQATADSQMTDGADAVATSTPEGAAATSDAGLTLPLSPENTRIEFVGTHVGEKPDPRKGSFGNFTGKLQVDPASQTLQSVSLDIETASLQTEFDKLTDHLKSPDFFDVRNHPKATFQSTKIEPAADKAGKFQITGNLTLHGVTKEISAPASLQIGPTGPSLRSELTLDRSEFGMDFGPDKVENKVALTVVMGAKGTAEQP